VTYLVAVSILGSLFIVWSRAVLSPDIPVPIVILILGVLAGVLALLLTLVLLFTLYRLVVWKPSVTVNADGIIDQCSLIAGGLGLIRWHEIEVIVIFAYNNRLEYIHVGTRDDMRPDNPLVRLFQRSITLTLPKGANLPQWLLSISVSELAAQIQEHYHATLVAKDIGILDFLHTSET
jgi:hypothetical protein